MDAQKIADLEEEIEELRGGEPVNEEEIARIEAEIVLRVENPTPRGLVIDLCGELGKLERKARRDGEAETDAVFKARLLVLPSLLKKADGHPVVADAGVVGSFGPTGAKLDSVACEWLPDTMTQQTRVFCKFAEPIAVQDRSDWERRLIRLSPSWTHRGSQEYWDLDVVEHEDAPVGMDDSLVRQFQTEFDALTFKNPPIIASKSSLHSRQTMINVCDANYHQFQNKNFTARGKVTCSLCDAQIDFSNTVQILSHLTDCPQRQNFETILAKHGPLVD